MQIQIFEDFSLCAYGVKPGVQQCAPASEASGSKVLRGGVALRRRRLPVDRLEYSHADVPVAQGGYAESKYTISQVLIATRWQALPELLKAQSMTIKDVDAKPHRHAHFFADLSSRVGVRL
ncbi:hypothetical protein A979_15973 [Pseudomonas syringae BRIP34876]|nr:hypothetical protein A979_15973 [Pseudomonas syringae BRIP34876]ELQ04500.1 hypothetical protein A987_08378 [Pseudomonas syringae BRIP34881]